MKRSILCMAATAALLAGAANAADKPEAILVPVNMPLTAASDPGYRALVSGKSVALVKYLDAHAELVDVSTDSFTIPIDGQSVMVFRQYTVDNADGSRAWYGLRAPDAALAAQMRAGGSAEIADDPMNSVMLIRRSNHLTSTVRHGDQLYALRSLDSGGHVLVRIDESRMPPDHPASQRRVPTIRMPTSAAEDGQVGAAVVAPSTIRVIVMTTQAAVDLHSNSRDIVIAVAKANQGMPTAASTSTCSWPACTPRRIRSPAVSAQIWRAFALRATA